MLRLGNHYYDPYVDPNLLRRPLSESADQLKPAHYERLEAVSPQVTPDRLPGSIYLVRK